MVNNSDISTIYSHAKTVVANTICNLVFGSQKKVKICSFNSVCDALVDIITIKTQGVLDNVVGKLCTDLTFFLRSDKELHTLDNVAGK